MAIDGKKVFVRIAGVFYCFDADQRQVLDLTKEDDRDIYAISFAEPRCHDHIEWATVVEDGDSKSLVIKHNSGFFRAKMDLNTRIFGPLKSLTSTVLQAVAADNIKEMRDASSEDAKLLGIDFLWMESPTSTGNLSAHGSHAMAAGGL